MKHNARDHLPATGGEAGCCRSGASRCWALHRSKYLSPKPTLQIGSEARPKYASCLLKYCESLRVIETAPSCGDLPDSCSPIARKSGRLVLPIVERALGEVVQYTTCLELVSLFQYLFKNDHWIALGNTHPVNAPVLRKLGGGTEEVLKREVEIASLSGKQQPSAHREVPVAQLC